MRGLAQHSRERLLHEVLGLLARSAQAPGSPVEPIDVVAQGLRIELTFGGHPVAGALASRARKLGQLRQRARAGPTYFAVGRISRPSRFCSRMCADQPAVRAQVNIGVNRSGGTSAKSSTTADQNSTLVASTRSGLRACELGQRGLLERLGDLDARRAELVGRAAQHAGARVLGAVDAVAEAHQPLAAVEHAP